MSKPSVPRSSTEKNNNARSAAFVNWPVLHKEMDRAGLDAIVAAAPDSVFYLAGSYIDCNLMFFDRLAFVVVPRKGHSTFIVCNIEEAVVKSVGWVDDVQTYAQYVESAGKLAAVLKERGLSNGRLGFEEKFFCTKLYWRVQEQLPHATLLAADSVIERAQTRKMPVEISALQETARLADEAAHAAWSHCQQGMTEYEIASAITIEMHARGGNRVDHIYVGSGASTQTIRHKPGAKRLAPGELLLSDFGVVRNQYGSGSGYWSDLTRMGVVGEPSARQREQYRILRDVQRAVIARMSPGTRCCDLYAFARDAYTEAGADDVLPRIGHSMPRSHGHELPLLDSLDTTPLEPNMVFAVSPSFRSGTERYEIKDLVLVTESEAKVLSDRWDTNELFGFG